MILDPKLLAHKNLLKSKDLDEIALKISLARAVLAPPPRLRLGPGTPPPKGPPLRGGWLAVVEVGVVVLWCVVGGWVVKRGRFDTKI